MDYLHANYNINQSSDTSSKFSPILGLSIYVSVTKATARAVRGS